MDPLWANIAGIIGLVTVSSPSTKQYSRSTSSPGPSSGGIGGYDSVHALNHAFELATRDMKVAFSRLYDAHAPDRTLEDAAKRANGQADLVSQVASRLLAAASNTIVRTTFSNARPWIFVEALTTELGDGF
jgi:hypothetical protein